MFKLKFQGNIAELLKFKDEIAYIDIENDGKEIFNVVYR